MTIMLGIIVKILLFVSVKCENVHLEKISNLFVPASFTESGAPVYSLGSGAAEQLTYDPRDRIVYVVGRQFTFFFIYSIFLFFFFYLDDCGAENINYLYYEPTGNKFTQVNVRGH